MCALCALRLRFSMSGRTDIALIPRHVETRSGCLYHTAGSLRSNVVPLAHVEEEMRIRERKLTHLACPDKNLVALH